MSAHLIDRSKGKTVYSQISRALEQDIKCHYQAGDFLPSEQELAARFCVNRHTLRRAIDELVNSGLVERHHGRGTIILEPPVDYSISKSSRFTETLESQGKTTHSKVIRKLTCPARAGVSQRLAVAEGSPVIWIETLRKVDGIPFCIISHFLPQHFFNELQFSKLQEEYNHGSLHQFIEQHFDIALERRESLITSVLPIGNDALILNTPQNTPVLRVKSVNINTLTQQPVEYSVTRFRADRVQLAINL